MISWASEGSVDDGAESAVLAERFASTGLNFGEILVNRYTDQEQSEPAKLAIRAMMSGYPLVCYGVGALLFLRFRLDRAAHAAIRAELDARKRAPARAQ